LLWGAIAKLKFPKPQQTSIILTFCFSLAVSKEI